MSKPASQQPDRRLYVPHPEGWAAHIKKGWEKFYCYYQNPEDDHFHLILNGEIYLQRADEKVCLNCALRRDLLTTDRLYWQHLEGTRKDKRPIV